MHGSAFHIQPDIKAVVGSQVGVKRLTGLPFWMSAGNLIDSREAERNYQTVSLHSAADGVGLGDCRGVPACSRWLYDMSRCLSG